MVPALLAASACGGSSGSRAAQSSGDRPTVVTSVTPLAWLSKQLGSGHVTIENLAGGADPHHVELTPRQILQVENADLVLYMKGLQPSMDEAVSAHARAHSLDATSVVDMLPATGHAHGPDGDTHGGTGGRAHGTYDPHFWLDPLRLAEAADALADRLAKVDPAHAGAYRQRAEEFNGKLEELDKEYASTLSDCESEVVVTNHKAFGYLAERYGLHQIGIRETLDADSQPSPRRMAEAVRIAKAKDVNTVFFDTSSSKDIATAIASEIGARTAGLHPIARRLQETGTLDYFPLMRDNLQTLRAGLGCS